MIGSEYLLRLYWQFGAIRLVGGLWGCWKLIPSYLDGTVKVIPEMGLLCLYETAFGD